MNNKGFAVTGFIYTIFVIFIVLLVAILSLFNTRKKTLDKLKREILNNISETSTDIYNYTPYTTVGGSQEFSAKTKGYYNFTLKSAKVGNTNGSTVSFEVYLNKGERLYITINTNGVIELRNEVNSKTLIARASSNTSLNYIANELNDKIITNSSIVNNNVTTTGSVTPSYITKTKVNENLNNVQYIKDCISGNSSGNTNDWTEIKAIVAGDNKAAGKKVTSSATISNLKNIVDNNKNTVASATSSSEQCVIVDLSRTYNIDMISILHKKDRTYYGSKTYVSSDNKNYKLIRNLEEKESSNGLMVSSYEKPLVRRVGNVYVPIKKFDGATWLRLLHHNTLNGTLYWDSMSQPLTNGGYDVLHKQSILYNTAAYKNKQGQFEFLLQYSDVSGYNRWIQTSNPVTTVEDVTGYKAVKTSWTTTAWYGLAKSTSSSTVIDGNKGNNWFYAVGITKPFNGGVPVDSTHVSKATTDLWVRIDNL